MAEAAEEKRGKYMIFCPDFVTITCVGCTQAVAIQRAIKLQRGFSDKIELVEITGDRGGVMIDIVTEGSDCHGNKKLPDEGG